MGARVYDPYTGTFLQTDPVQGGGANAYGYTNGDPVNETDLNGQQAGIPMCKYYHTCGPPTLSDVLQVVTFATLPAALIDPIGDAFDAADATEVTVSASRYPESAAHIEDAQAAGQPSELTIDRAGAAARRSAALQGTKSASGLDRDEYPPAMFEEGGNGASVRSIGSGDNRGAGASIGAQTRGLSEGALVRLRVIP
jgi:uncharacterized protein RhaS with RHS repeats